MSVGNSKEGNAIGHRGMEGYFLALGLLGARDLYVPKWSELDDCQSDKWNLNVA